MILIQYFVFRDDTILGEWIIAPMEVGDKSNNRKQGKKTMR